MTIEEVSERFNISQSSIKTKFSRTQEAIYKKYGVHLIKIGRGASASYEVQEESRALTMYEEVKEEVILNHETLKMMNWTFCVFLGITLTPMLVFRGSYRDFLMYIQATISESNIAALKESLEELRDAEYISYNIDKTNNDYFVAALYRKTEEDMSIGINMVRRCKALATANKKQSFVPILKTWLGMNMLAGRDIFKMSDLRELTGLSDYQIREACKLLERDEIFKRTRAYADFNVCIGTTVDMNAFYN